MEVTYYVPEKLSESPDKEFAGEGDYEEGIYASEWWEREPQQIEDLGRWNSDLPLLYGLLLFSLSLLLLFYLVATRTLPFVLFTADSVDVIELQLSVKSCKNQIIMPYWIHSVVKYNVLPRIKWTALIGLQ